MMISIGLYDVPLKFDLYGCVYVTFFQFQYYPYFIIVYDYYRYCNVVGKQIQELYCVIIK